MHAGPGIPTVAAAPRRPTVRPPRQAGALAAAALAGVVVLLALAACAPLRGVEAVRLLEDLAAGGGSSSLARETPEPRREAETYLAGTTRRAADLYRPGRGRASAAVVLVPGATPLGKDDPRLQDFARSLARARFAVLVPEIGGLRRLRLGPEQARDVAAALEHLAQRAGAAGRPALGLVAISYGAGPAMLAVLDHGAERHLRFIVLIGGYYDIEAAVAFTTTGFYRPAPGAPWQRGTPDPRAKWTFLRSNIGRVEDADDRARLAAIARRKLRDPAAQVAGLVSRLGREGRAVYALLANDDPERVPTLIEQLPPTVHTDIRALDLSRRDLSGLRPRLILIHGRDDPVIPAAQSRALARAAPQRSRLYEVDSLRHVDLGGPGVGDALTLWRAAYQALAERDAAPRPDL